MKSIIKIFPVNCGDAIRIVQKNRKGTIGNILIDSGYIGTYEVLKSGIRDILENKRKIDLWVLTHLDADHINGAIEFFRDPEIEDKDKIVKKLWFNFFNPFKVPISSEYVSLDKGILLRKFLRKLNIDYNDKIVVSSKKIKLNNAFLTILSPDEKTYDELRDHWQREEKKYVEIEGDTYAAALSKNYDQKTIIELAKIPDKKESPKKELTNRSSIAFLYESNGKKALFLGDAMPSMIVKSLKTLGYSKKKKLKIKYLKLSHHGSRANYNNELLEYIDCNEFIISANGVNSHGIPDKEVLSKILLHPCRNQREKIKFYFNYADERFVNLFDADSADLDRYNFETIFPKVGKTLKLKF